MSFSRRKAILAGDDAGRQEHHRLAVTVEIPSERKRCPSRGMLASSGDAVALLGTLLLDHAADDDGHAVSHHDRGLGQRLADHRRAFLRQAVVPLR